MTVSHVVEDRDIFRVADNLLRNHGEEAAIQCANLVDRWTARGDKEAAEVWRRVLVAVCELATLRVH